MPLAGPRNRKRRGRPKRKGQQMQNDQQKHFSNNNDLSTIYSTGLDMSMNDIQQPLSTSNSTISTSGYDKFREEQPYKDFYPDLNITQTLSIIRRTRNPYSDDSPSLMNDTTIVTGISTIPVNTTTTSLLSTDTSNKRRSLDYLDNVPGLSDNTIAYSATPCFLEETLKIPRTTNEEITTHSTTPSPWKATLSQPNSSSIMTPASRKGGAANRALTTRSHTAVATVDLTALPKPSFRKVTDENDEPSRTTKVTATTDTKMRQNLNKTKTKTPGELSNETAPGSDTEGDYEYKDIDDQGDGGSESIGKNIGYHRPENHYIRYIEPTEQSLFEMVEYDMDEQDDAWLQMLNAERKINRLGQVSCSFFENVIDKLEKEWFDLVKRLPKQTESERILSEDSACSICDDGECENSNAIVFCDGCNLAVHQDCYGVPYIPEGQWLCRKCMVSPDKPVTCLFCPNEGGAFKQTNTNKWGHLLCALWIPEVGVSNSVYMEPIDNIEGIPKSRWKLTCYICKKRHGACIQCDNKHCFTAFHATCARWARLCMRMKTHGAHNDSVLLKAYCDRHTPRDYRDEVDVAKCVLAAQKFLDSKAMNNQGRSNSSCTPMRRYVDKLDGNGDNDMEYDADGGADNDYGDDDNYTSGNRQHLNGLGTKKRKHNDNSSPHGTKKRKALSTTSQQLTPSIKAARAHQHHYSAGAPIAPDYILARLENLKCVRQASHLRRRCQLITSICRYWSLKRESRRGAPLLKRLHLEPWTASSSQLKQNELEKAHRAKILFELRTDLELVRMLSEQVQKREKQKLEQLRRQKEYIEMVLFPVEHIIRPILNHLMEMDKKDYFLYPVTSDIAPDYRDFIDHPMCFQDIIKKFHAHEYTTLESVEADLSLIWTNSKTYNQSDTSYYKLAQRMEEQATELITKAQQYHKVLDISQYTGALAAGIDPEVFSYSLAPIIPSPAESKMETNAQSDNISKYGQKDEETVPTNERIQLTQPMTPASNSKRQTTRSNQKKQPNILPRRTTRSTSTGTVHINLDDRPPKRKKHSSKSSPSPSPSTSTLAQLSVSLHINNATTSTSSQESQPVLAPELKSMASIGNRQTDTMIIPFSSSSKIPRQTQSSSEPQTAPILSSINPSSPPLSLDQQSPALLSSEQHSSPQLLLKQHSPSPSLSVQQSPALLLSKQQASLDQQQQQQPLIDTIRTKTPTPLLISPRLCPGLTPAALKLPLQPKQNDKLKKEPAQTKQNDKLNKESAQIKRSNKLTKEIVVSRRRTRSSGSDGLTIPTKTGMKNRKMNKETRKLLIPDTMDKPVAYEEGSYKESTTRRAPCGYVYISSSDEDDESSGDGVMTEDRRGSDEQLSLTTCTTGKKSTANPTSNSNPSTIESDVKQVGNVDNIDNKIHRHTKRPSAKRQTKRSPAKKTKSDRPQLPSAELRTTTPGEIVWARVPGFPFHPAKIVDTEQIAISKTLEANRREYKPVLVMFYQVPESHKWGWIKPADIYKFGNGESDRIMLEHAKAMIGHRKSRFNEVFQGYEYVCKELGLQVQQI